VAVDRDPDRGPAELHRERETLEPVDQPWLEMQTAVADAAAGVAALQTSQVSTPAASRRQNTGFPYSEVGSITMQVTPQMTQAIGHREQRAGHRE